MLAHIEPIVWTSLRPEFLLQSALLRRDENHDTDDDNVKDNDNDDLEDSLVAVVSGFHRLIMERRLAETKVAIYTQLLNACQRPQRTDMDNDIHGQVGNHHVDIVHMCIQLYKAYPMRRTADALIRKLNAIETVMDEGRPERHLWRTDELLLLKRAQLADDGAATT